MKRPAIFIVLTKRRLYYLVLALVIVILTVTYMTSLFQRTISVYFFNALEGRTIAIDPGHGGIDGGTHFGDAILEKHINLEISLRLKEELENEGATVIMTRESDVSLDDHINNGSRHREDLNERVRIINNSEAEIFISIHANCIKNTNKQGPIVFYHGNSEESKAMAELLQRNLNRLSAYEKLDLKAYHSATKGDYFILNNTAAPGVIVEAGFISNEIDRGLLLDEKHQREIVEQIIQGIIEYFN